MIVEFLQSHPGVLYLYLILSLMLVIILSIVLLKKIGFERIRKVVYKAFVTAENHFNSGDEKFSYVVEVAKSNIPAPFNLFITEKTLKTTIQLWFDLCKDLLDDGRINEVKDYKAFKKD